MIDDIVSKRIAANQSDPTVKVNLDFGDLGQIINGKPGNPIALRPFERAFTKERIMHSTEKLGLAPVNLRTALSHSRVRDDSTDGSRSELVVDLIEKNRGTLQAIAEHGFNAVPLQVDLVKDPRQASPAIVAPPAEWEER